jgi:hypothetical protein
MPRFDYAKSNDGRVHLVSALNGEYTLCGDAYDGGLAIDEDNQSDWTGQKSGPVTCPKCIKEIESCRGVRVQPATV